MNIRPRFDFVFEGQLVILCVSDDDDDSERTASGKGNVSGVQLGHLRSACDGGTLCTCRRWSIDALPASS